TSRSASRPATAPVSSAEPETSSVTMQLEKTELNRVLLGLRSGLGGLLTRGRRVDAFEQRGDAAEILFQHLQHRRRLERRSGVIEGVEEQAAGAERDLVRLTVDAGDTEWLAGEKLRGEVAQRRHEPRLDQLDLAEQVRLAGCDLVRHRITVAGRPAFEHV